jgi:hypothetical protein
MYRLHPSRGFAFRSQAQAIPNYGDNSCPVIEHERDKSETFGETGRAISEIEHLLTTPFALDCADDSITLFDLRTFGEWDPLRNNPRFQKIPVDSYLAKRWRNLRSGKRRACSASVSDAEFLLPSLFRFCSQRESTGQGIEDFRVPERPSIINRHSVEAPLVAIPHQVAIVAIHQ